MMAVKLVTYADYVALPDDGKRYEILDGELVVTPAPSRKHQRVVLRLAALLDAHVTAQPRRGRHRAVRRHPQRSERRAAGHHLRRDRPPAIVLGSRLRRRAHVGRRGPLPIDRACRPAPEARDLRASQGALVLDRRPRGAHDRCPCPRGELLPDTGPVQRRPSRRSPTVSVSAARRGSALVPVTQGPGRLTGDRAGR